MAKRSNVKKIEAVEMIEETVETVVETKEAKAEPIVLNKDQQTAYNDLKTKSAKIRYLHGEKFSRSQIANYLGIRYQHVRNVLTTELKRTKA